MLYLNQKGQWTGKVMKEEKQHEYVKGELASTAYHCESQKLLTPVIY
jgi:hypothetical protein